MLRRRGRRREPSRRTNVAIGIAAVLVLAIGSYLAFVKRIPFADRGFEVNAVFSSSTTLRTTSPVRIAGVDVGEVIDIDRHGDGAEVTFTVDEEGLPLHTDAEVKIRPRLFLEGNFFLDLRPGSPSAPELDEEGTIPVAQTARAVQLDEVLTALQQPERRDLVRLLEGLGTALTHQPTPAQDADQDPAVRGESAAQAINDSFRFGGRAGRAGAQVSEALRGQGPNDLPRLLRGGGRTFAKLASREQDLRELITNFNVTAEAFAAEAGSLRETLAELAPTLERAGPSLRRLDQTFPPLRRFADAALPGVRELPATLAAGRPWLRQARPLLGEPELGRIARDLRIATPPLAGATAQAQGLTRQIGLTSRCTSNVLVPTGDTIIDRPDDPFTTGVASVNEFLFGLVNQSGQGQSFDGNGTFLRVQPGGGPVTAAAAQPNGGTNQEELFSHTIEPPRGTQPALPSRRPPQRSDVRCHTNPVPDLNGPAAAVGPPAPEAE